MKKETKKRIINTALITTISSTAVAPITIALKNNLDKNELNQGVVDARGIVNGDFGITSNQTFYVNKKGNGGRKDTYNISPDTTTSIPNGYVTVVNSGISGREGNRLICINRNNPNQIDWYYQDNYDKRILSVEYTSYSDSLVLLTLGDSGGGVYINVIRNISNIKDGENIVSKTYYRKFVTNSYQGTTHEQAEWLENWTMTPIYKASAADGDGGQVTDYLLYSQGTAWSDRWPSAWRFNIKDGSWGERIDFKFPGTPYLSTIPAIGAFWWGGQIHMVIFRKLDPKNWATRTQLLYQVGNSNKDWKDAGDTNRGTMNFGATMGAEFAINMPSIPSFEFFNDGTIDVIFADNMNGNESNGWRRTPQIIGLTLDPRNQRLAYNGYKFAPLFRDWRSGSSFTGWQTELWFAKSVNDVIARRGLKDGTFNNSTPIIGSGWTDAGWFTFVLNDPSFHVLPTNLNGQSNFRIYRNDRDRKNQDTSYIYSGFGQSDYGSGQMHGRGYLMGRAGVPILEYINTKNDIYLANVLQLRNNSDEGMFINQYNRGINTYDAASYGYHTVARNVTLNIGDSNKSIADVTASYLIDKYHIESEPWYKSSFLSVDVGVYQSIDNAVYTIKPDTMSWDYNNGWITFDLFTTALYLNDGKLNITSSLSRLKENWWPAHKVARITIKGFKKVEVTTAVSTTINKISSGNIPVSTITPQYAAKYSNFEKDSSYWHFRECIWRAICDGEIFTNLRQKPPTYNQNTWTDEWNSFFDSFTYNGYNNEDGSVTVSFTVNKEWGVGISNGNIVAPSFRNIKLFGLRKLLKTELVSNNEETAITVSEWSNKNIPYQNGNSLLYPSYMVPGTEKISEDDIKTYLFENLYKDAYNSSTQINGFNASNQYIKNMPYSEFAYNMNGRQPESLKKLTKDNIYLTNYRFYPAKGMMAVEVRFNVWQDPNSYSDYGLHWSNSTSVGGINGTDSIDNAPFATIYLKGFRSDNVITKLDEKTIWDLSEFTSNISITQAFNPKNRIVVEKAILSIGLKNNYIKLPYWVDKQHYLDLLNNYENNREVRYDVRSVDVSTGNGVLSVGFKNIGWFAETNGSVVQHDPEGTNGTPEWDKWTWDVKVVGFKPISPIAVDSSKFFELSNTLQNVLYVAPLTTSNEFKSWLRSVQERITNYIWDQDKKINGDGAISLDDWKSRLTYKYTLQTASSSQTYDINSLQSAISDLVMAATGKLDYLYNTNILKGGIKVWIKVYDNSEGFNSSIQDASTNPDLGQNLSGVLDTTKIVLDRDLVNWFNVLDDHKATTCVGYNEVTGYVESVVPPVVLNSPSAVGKNMPFEQVVSYLKTIGYKTLYTWIDKEGQEKTSTDLPTNFSINQESPYIYFKLWFDKDNFIPANYVFADPQHLITEYTVKLSLDIKQVITLSFSPFKNMKENSIFSSTNILINSDGTYDSQTVATVRDNWKAFENKYWELVSDGSQETINLYKNLFEIRYSIDSSQFDYTYETMWGKIGEVWKIASSPQNEMAKLRFYSENFAKGLKISVTIKFKNPADEDQYKLQFDDGSTNSIVNHGMGTTFDFDKMAKFFESNKAIAGVGSIAEDLKGFTPASYEGVDFDQLVKKLDIMGVSFQYSGDKRTWVETREEVRTVDKNNPVVYMRMYTKTTDQQYWSNEFDIKNFAIGTTNSASGNNSDVYSSGVTLSLDLPKYLVIEDQWMTEFINNSKSAWSGNTKNMSIDNAIMQTAIDNLVNKIIAENGATTLTKDDFKVEFKVDANEAVSGSGNQFKAYSSTFTNAIANGDYWNAYNNGVFVRVVLNVTDGNTEYDNVNTTFNNENKEFALTVKPYTYFANTAGSNNFDENVNPIKFWLPSVENQLQSIKVNGTTIQNISLTYPEPMYFDTHDQKVYTDQTKRLAVQFSVKDVRSYDDPNADWTLIPPTEISVDKWLFVRVVENYNDVVYGPIESKTAKAWPLDTAAIKPVIEADIPVLSSFVFSGTLNIAGTNEFNLETLRVEEKRIINEAVSTETGRKKVEVIYNLRTSSSDSNNEWVTLEVLIEKLAKEVKRFSNNVFGIASFIQGQYSIKASLRSTDPEFNIIDKNTQTYEPVNEGVLINTQQIVTKINLTDWINFLETNKALVVTRTKSSRQTRAIVELTDKVLQPKPMPGNIGESFLSGRSFNEIISLLSNTFAVRFEFSTNESDWVSSIAEIRSFDDKVNKVWMRVYESTYNSQIKLFDEDAEITSTPKTIVMNIQYPKTLTVKEVWVQEYIDSLPVSGNTKYLEIDKTKEDELVKKVVDANPPVAGDPAPTVWVEYSLGNTGWLKRDAFIQKLKDARNDQSTNEIKIRLAVDPIDQEEPIYAIDQKEYVLNPHGISDISAVKIFVNRNYEIEASKVSVSGSDDVFTYNYGSLPVSNGTWTGSAGLRIQWTTDTTASYSDPSDDAKWSNTQIEKINPVERYLAIRIIAEPGYIYTAAYTNPSLGVTPSPEASVRIVNTDNIKSKLLVDLDELQANLVLEGYANDLNLEKLNQSAQQILASINGGDKLDIVYNVVLPSGQKLSKTWMNSDELEAALQNYSTTYTNSTQGLIKFTANGVEGAKLMATFVSTDDKFSPMDPDADVETGIATNTDNVKTKIDLSTWYKSLSTNSTTFDTNSTSANISGLTPPGVPGNRGEGFLTGLSYSDIMSILDKMGLKAEFKAPGSTTGENWVPLDQIHSLNNANELFIRINLKTLEWRNTLEVVGLNGVQNFDNPEKIKLVIKLPITIVVDKNELLKLKFEGTTIDITNLTILKTTEQEIIKKVKESNKIGNPTTDAEIEAAAIEVRYSLAGMVIDTAPGTDKVWLTLDEMQTALSTSKINYGTNEVKAKFVITNNTEIDENGTLKYQLSDINPININEKDLTDTAVFKIYIHNVDATTPQWMFDNLKLSGSQDSYVISNYDNWKRQIPAGLVAEFNSVPLNGEPDPAHWSTNPNANPISVTKEYWVRFKVQPGYVFENPSSEDPKLTTPVKLDTTKIQVALKISSEWLASISLTGNTKNLVINETQAIQKVVDAGQMSPEGIIKIEYTVDGKEWLSKDDFVAKLVQLDGAIDETKWLILREDIKARFILDEKINATLETPILLFVDGVLIDSNDKSPKVQLIDDAKGINTSVKGYINANKLKPFIASNFVVRGTNTNATLEISQADKFNEMLNPYSSANAFKMLYASKQDAFIDDQQVWIPGRGVSATTKLKGDYAQKYFAVALQSANQNYEVYHNNTLQQNGYVLSTPDIQVFISTAITNPLIGKNVSIKFKLDGEKATFYQNKGAFVAYVEKDGQQLTFDEYINSLGEDVLFQGEKDALELAYYVSDHELTEAEYREITSVAKITDYTPSTEKYGVWKSYPRDITDYKQLNLDLKVNDYVVVALRVKETALSSDTNPNGYVIEDDNHTPQTPQRAYGFYIKADEVNVNWGEMKLKNVGKAQSASYGLDGYAMLNRLSLIQDANGNYLGVSLKLKYFDTFYEDASGNILVSNTGERLVKRDSNGAVQKGFYLDETGQPLVDKEGNQIPIYETPEGLPSAPIKEPNATREVELEEIATNTFTLNIIPFGNNQNKLAQHSFFKYQTIAIEFGDKKGKATGNEFDYYVDQVVSREYKLDSEIKFPIPNPTNITYKFNSEEYIKFIRDEQNINQGLVFRNDVNPEKVPINGQATLTHMFNVIRKEQPQSSTIPQETTLTTLDEISNQLQQDFGGKVVLKVTYTSVDGQVTIVQGLGDTVSLEQFNRLKNGDKFEISIVSADENNFIFAQQPASLIFVINGLKAQGLDDLSLLQYLRVDQIGEFNGEGAFAVLADNPNDPNDPVDIEAIVPGFKFSIRVWGTDKAIKHDWTTDFNSINDLVNGDWVEWRLVEATSGNPSATEFYNTVSDPENSDANQGNIQYKQVLLEGENTVELSETPGIGSAPKDVNTYPGDRSTQSGFKIAGLREKPAEFPTLTQEEFDKLVDSMDITYTGINGMGDMIISQDVLNSVVTTTGESRKAWTLSELIKEGYVTFRQNGVALPRFEIGTQDGEVVKAGPGCLSNGDKITIEFNNSDGDVIIANAPDVSGLDNKSDSMSMLAWVGVGAVSVATLGIFIFIYLFARNRKLKK